MTVLLRTIASAVLMLALGARGEATPLPKQRNAPKGDSFGVIVDAAGFKPGDAVDVILNEITPRGVLRSGVALREAEVVVVEPAGGRWSPRSFVQLRVDPKAIPSLLAVQQRGVLSLAPTPALDWAGELEPMILGIDW
jgi:hypothetical protein